MIWSSIVTMPVAVIEATFCCFLLLLVTALALGIGGAVVQYVNNYAISDEIAAVVGAYLIIVVLIFLGYFIMCVLLCKGIFEKKPNLIITYVIFGSISWVIAVVKAIRVESRKFSKDNSFLILSLYVLYLVMLIINIVEIKKNKNRVNQGQVIVAAPAPCSPSANYSPTAKYSPPPAYSPAVPYSTPPTYSPPALHSPTATYSPPAAYSPAVPYSKPPTYSPPVPYSFPKPYPK